MKILVTGGSGFIGGHVVQELESRDLGEVFILDVKPPNFITNATLLTQDITEDISVDMNEIDLIIHCAGILGAATTFAKMRYTYAVNIMGTLRLLETVTQASNRPRVLNPTLLKLWYSPYMITKHAAARTGTMFAIEEGVEFLNVGTTVVYGPRQHWKDGKVIPIFLTKALSDEPLQIYGDGTTTMSMVYVKDIARLLVDIGLNDQIFADKCYEIVVTSPDDDISVLALAKLVVKLTGGNGGIEFVEMRKGQPKKGDIVEYDLGVAKKYIPDYEQQFVTLEEGLRQTIGWYKGTL